MIIAPVLTGIGGERPPNSEASENIVVYDLRYALEVNASKRKEIEVAWDHVHALSTLQGIVNRDAPRLYYFYVDSPQLPGVNLDQWWLEKFTGTEQWLHGREQERLTRVEELMARFRTRIKGVVVYDPKVPATSNVASAVAGAEDCVAIRWDRAAGSLYSKLVGSGPELPVKVWLVEPDGRSKFTGKGNIPGTEMDSTGSAKADAYLWMRERYLNRDRLNPAYGAYYIDAWWLNKPRAAVLNHHTLSNHDFFVAHKAFFFDLSPWADEPATDDPAQRVGLDADIMKRILLAAWERTNGDKIIHIGGFPPWAYKYTKHAGGQHEDVPTEWEYVKIISAYNGFQDADAIAYGAMANASFWQHFPLREAYPQKRPAVAELVERGYLTTDMKLVREGREFILFYVGDYDSASWIYQRMPDIWEDPERGEFPLMWCVSPVLERRAPMVMHYLRETATTNDYFAAADNGAGYLNPSMLTEPRGISGLPEGLSAWTRHCSRYYERWDLDMTGFIIDGYAPPMTDEALRAYATFSPGGVVPQKVPPARLVEGMPVLRADHDVNEPDPKQAAAHILQRVEARDLPFHWFRNILKSPRWYREVMEEIGRQAPEVELLDAPTFFALLKAYLKEGERD